jgi:tight adherence protein C
MLLSSGYSMGAAIARVAERGDGVCARAFGRITIRVRQGLSDIDALREWAGLAQVPALDRLVRVLELNFQAADLGELISAEARSTRREAQRSLEELIERRSQTVWIPVTVATLVPGVIFMAVPFVDAMGKLTGR